MLPPTQLPLHKHMPPQMPRSRRRGRAYERQVLSTSGSWSCRRSELRSTYHFAPPADAEGERPRVLDPARRVRGVGLAPQEIRESPLGALLAEMKFDTVRNRAQANVPSVSDAHDGQFENTTYLVIRVVPLSHARCLQRLQCSRQERSGLIQIFRVHFQTGILVWCSFQ
ncbi:hypothetical protein EDB85DRAFT_2023154 [Lactarius pseudohatsudake]|nr:hypothetical protein EDB85DRAFT_2023154 [Lactarius pseudohatsudake]